MLLIYCFYKWERIFIRPSDASYYFFVLFTIPGRQRCSVRRNARTYHLLRLNIMNHRFYYYVNLSWRCFSIIILRIIHILSIVRSSGIFFRFHNKRFGKENYVFTRRIWIAKPIALHSLNIFRKPFCLQHSLCGLVRA